MSYLRNTNFKITLLFIGILSFTNCKQKSLLESYCDNNTLNCTTKKHKLLFIYYSPYNCIACDKILQDLMINKTVQNNSILYFPVELSRDVDIEQFENQIKELTGLKTNILKDEILYKTIILEAKKNNTFEMTNPLIIEYDLLTKKLKHIKNHTTLFKES